MPSVGPVAALHSDLSTINGYIVIPNSATVGNDLSVTDDLTVGDDITLAAGSVATWATDTNLYRSAADTLKTDDNLVVGVKLTAASQAIAGLTTYAAPGGLAFTAGATARLGFGQLVGGTLVVNNATVNANTLIFLTSQVDGGTPGFLRVTAKVAGVSFTVTSSSVLDTSTFAYLLIDLV